MSTLDDFIRASHKTPLLTKQQEIQLSRQYRQSLDPAATKQQQRIGKRAKDRMILSNQRLVAKAVGKFRMRLNGSGIEAEDLFQAGMMGLVRAVELFDSERGYAFSTYATLWLEQSIRRELDIARDAIRPPTTAIDITRRWKYRPTGQTLEEFCQQWNYTPEKVRLELEHAARANVASLDKRLADDVADGLTLADTIAVDSNYDIEHNDYIDAVDALREQHPDHVAALEIYQAGGKKGEIAALLGVTAHGLTRHIDSIRQELRTIVPSGVAVMMGETALAPVAVLDKPDFHEVSPLHMSVVEPSMNGRRDKLEALIADVQDEPVAEAPKPKRRGRRTRQQIEAAKAAQAPVAAVGMLTMTMGGAEIKGGPVELAALLRELNAAA